MTCHILNKCRIKPILKKTPYELWRGKKPNISYFHHFGCKCSIHNNGKNNLRKFDPRRDEGNFLGYSPTCRAYRAYKKQTLCVEESVRIVFDESNLISVSLSFDEEQVNNSQSRVDSDIAL